MVYVDSFFKGVIINNVSVEIVSKSIISIVGVVDEFFGEFVNRVFFDFIFILNGNNGRFGILSDDSYMFLLGVDFG